ncbi:hypothetical protein scyTo_0027193 [Scyliorhinus torazame]|uniref:Uncharacterized protein n=2 Tax=Scyliorhinus torazame TaxID=75743 RepID=A0A401QMG0_SCYTO|nr:hypothetical protein [Scyliorhinus torazame]
MEKQRMKDLQSVRKSEERLTLPKDPTHAVFDTPVSEKTSLIQLEPPVEQPRNTNRKKRLFKRQRIKLRR